MYPFESADLGTSGTAHQRRMCAGRRVTGENVKGKLSSAVRGERACSCEARDWGSDGCMRGPTMKLADDTRTPTPLLPYCRR